MHKDVSFTLDLLRQSKAKPAKMALEMVSHLRAELVRMENQGVAKMQRARVKQEAYDAIRADLADANAAEAERLRVELDRLRVAYEKDYAMNAQANDRKVQAAQRRYNAMTEGELRKEKEKVLSGQYPAGTDPAILDELAICLKYVGDAEGQIELRDSLKQRNYDQPWTHTPTGANIAGELKAVEQAGGDLVVNHEGKFFTVSPLDIEAFFKEESEDTEAENAALQ